MSRALGRIAALAGLAAAAWLVWHDHPGAVWALLLAAGAGLLLAGAIHVLPMLANACAWRMLLSPPPRLTLGQMGQLVWIRESVNGLLPVARIGGEIVSFRLMRSFGLETAESIASLVVDTQLTVVGQFLFTLLSLGYLLTCTASSALHLAGKLLWGLAALAPILAVFALMHHARPFERAGRLLHGLIGEKFAAFRSDSAAIDGQIAAIWRRSALALRFLLLWYPLQSFATSLELWLALRYLGASVSVVQALVLEALIQAASSAAFFVPGGLGVQEGAFVLVGHVFGLEPPLCLALAGARRIRDLMIFGPGLLAWQLRAA